MTLIAIHLLQNHAPSNLNRDDNGDPKDAMFGGARRARISSQALKRSVRTSPQFQAADVYKRQEVRSFYDPSPLTVVGIHRLLSAILQSIYDPQSLDDIAELLEQGRFEQFRLDAFGTQYGARFSLFDATDPFMQTSDVPASPGKEAKTVAYLLAELPSGTNRIHFQHCLLYTSRCV